MISPTAVAVAVRDDHGRGSACAKAVGASTRRSVGTSVTARIPNACAWSGAGRRPGGRPNGVRTMPPKPSTPRPNARGSSPQLPKQPEVATARGHAAKIFSRLLCATGRGVMNRPASQAATRRATAAPPAVKPFAGCSIANASGCGAALFQAAARAIGSTRPRAPSAAACHTTHPTRRRRGKSGPQPRRSAVDSFTPQAP